MKADRVPHVIQVQQSIADELEQLVHWVGRRYGLGQRAARRFVGRRLNQRTLLTWRISVAKGVPTSLWVSVPDRKDHCDHHH